MPRGVSPAPLNIGGPGETSHHRQDSFASSCYSDKEKVREANRYPLLRAALRSNYPQDSPRSSHFEDYRKLLSSHSSQSHKSDSGSSKPHSPTVNVYTHCGRHSDQYLFSGWSNIKSALRRSRPEPSNSKLTFVLQLPMYNCSFSV